MHCRTMAAEDEELQRFRRAEFLFFFVFVVDDEDFFALGGELQPLTNFDFLLPGIFLEPLNTLLLLLDLAMHSFVRGFVVLHLAALFHQPGNSIWTPQLHKGIDNPE